MYRMTPAGAVLLGESHTAAFRAQVLHGGKPVHELSILSGSVSAAANRPVHRNMSLTLGDPDGSLSRSDAGDLLSPYDAEVKPWSGVRLPSGAVDWVPDGVYRLTSSDVSTSRGGLSIGVSGQDRASIYRVPLPGPVVVAANTSVEQAIGLLLSRVNAGFNWSPWRTGTVVGPLLYDSDSEAWDAALTLAESVGGWLYHDRNGVPVLAPYAAATTKTTQRFDRTLLTASRSENSEQIRNSVVMQSADTGPGVIRVTVEDTDRDSDTYVLGAFGRRQVTVTNPHLGSVAQAQRAGMARLVQELGRSEAVSCTSLPDPQTDVGDAVIVNAPGAGVYARRVVVESVTRSYDAMSTMQVTARRSVVAPDGSDLVLL